MRKKVFSLVAAALLATTSCSQAPSTPTAASGPADPKTAVAASVPSPASTARTDAPAAAATPTLAAQTKTQPTQTASPSVTSKQPETVLVFSNYNSAVVSSQPSGPTTFTLGESKKIYLIQDYHWNNAKGKSPGTIALRSSDGKEYGPWTAEGAPGQGGVPNAYWTVYPNTEIAAGTYTIVDSDPASWAQNAGSKGLGMSQVYALAQPAAATPTLAAQTKTQPTQTASASVPSKQPETVLVFSNYNSAVVSSQPSGPTTFTLGESKKIYLIQDYHWNNAKGKSPGTIALRSSDGKEYGPWTAEGAPGQGGVPNAYWTAYPNTEIPAGTYTIVDSDPASWAQNAGSKGLGMSQVYAVK